MKRNIPNATCSSKESNSRKKYLWEEDDRIWEWNNDCLGSLEDYVGFEDERGYGDLGNARDDSRRMQQCSSICSPRPIEHRIVCVDELWSASGLISPDLLLLGPLLLFSYYRICDYFQESRILHGCWRYKWTTTTGINVLVHLFLVWTDFTQTQTVSRKLYSQVCQHSLFRDYHRVDKLSRCIPLIRPSSQKRDFGQAFKISHSRSHVVPRPTHHTS